jgi:hypothetical protein
VHAWQSIGASQQVLRWLRTGVPIPWAKEEPAPFRQNNRRFTEEEEQWLRKERDRCLATGAWEPAECSSYVSPVHVVPKPHSEKMRVVIDLRHLNEHCPTLPAKFERLKDLEHLARKDDWMFSLDLQDGYHQIPIAPQFRRFFTFEVLGQLYQAAALPFGWSLSPLVFTKVMRVPAAHLRSVGVRLLLYLDDWLFLAATRSDALATRALVDHLFRILGLRRNPEKGVWDPTQRLQHLGLLVDTVKGVFRVPDEKLVRLHKSASTLLHHANSHCRWVSARQLAAFTGLATSVKMALPEQPLRTRSLHDALRKLRSWGADVQLSRQALKDLQWWRRLPADHLAGPIWRPTTTATVTTDASGDIGWGAHLNDGQATASDTWALEEAPLHITHKELLAVDKALVLFGSQLQDHNVRLQSDNSAVVAIVNSGSSRSAALMQLVRQLWQRAASLRLRLFASYVSTHSNHLADDLSRGRRAPAWRLPQPLFEQLQQRFGPHDVDRFASVHSRLLHRWNSLDSDGAEAVDAFSVSWARANNYINAPWDLLPRVINKLRTERAVATVIAPWWPSQSWWPDLQAMTVAHMRLRLPMDLPLSHPHHRPPEPLRHPAWRVYAFRVQPVHHQ